MPLLGDKICLITGATGIAAATAMHAAREGASVFVASLLESDCAALAATVRAAGGRCQYLAGDLTDEAVAADAVRRCRETLGRIDAVFNVVGLSGRRFGDGPVHACSTQGWRTTLATNLDTTFFVCRSAVQAMLAQVPGPAGLRGAIVNTASVLATSPRADHFATHAYAASKGAILALTTSMAACYAPQGIRVNAIAPGLVRTPMSARAQQDPRIVELLKSKQPLTGDFLDPPDVAAAAVFLMSDLARGITGVSLTVDGGWCVSG